MVRSGCAAKELHLPSFVLLDPPASSPRCCSLSGGIASGGEIRSGSAIPAKEMVVSLVSRRGRRLQRYKAGRRLVVGCIPYKFKMENPSPGAIHPAIEVLVVSSQKGTELMFPKGGWELDETKAAAASREAFEEAGVTGNFKGHLGRWLSEDQDKIHYMFAMEVAEVLQQWPEMNSRERKWVSIAEARQVCKHSWMREALDKFEELL
ncbi:nudix hydrolase 18, mitochondrial-like [Zingiber officinale]|uniref:nudix hydrolase 18, mitochondrial-like n=1 Tax=Zingiber officinale TaxID=94328 RepID=UPI001C4B6258|nr:nudix hydrolase 18, mitochondrial-like [Zingiber officinale]